MGPLRGNKPGGPSGCRQGDELEWLPMCIPILPSKHFNYLRSVSYYALPVCEFYGVRIQFKVDLTDTEEIKFRRQEWWNTQYYISHYVNLLKEIEVVNEAFDCFNSFHSSQKKQLLMHKGPMKLDLRDPEKV